jgi:hypothetical protein
VTRLFLLPLLLASSACGNAPSEAAAGVVAACPATLAANDPLAPGARRFGAVGAAALPLSEASTATIPVAQADPANGLLDEDEPLATEAAGDGVLVAATYTVASGQAPVSLVCRYGRATTPGQGAMTTPAMLLVPVRPQDATCRFVAARAGHPASMACRPGLPKE